MILTCTLRRASSTHTSTKKRTVIPTPNTIPTPSAINDNPLVVLETDDYKILLKHILYNINHWKPENLTAKLLCHLIHSDLTPGDLTRIRPEDEETSIISIPFQVV